MWPGGAKQCGWRSVEGYVGGGKKAVVLVMGRERERETTIRISDI